MHRKLLKVHTLLMLLYCTLISYSTSDRTERVQFVLYCTLVFCLYSLLSVQLYRIDAQ